MSLSEFIAATQAEMKQTMTMLEDSYSKKLEEYNSKLIKNSKNELYTINHGKLELTIDTILSKANPVYWHKQCTDSANISFKQKVLDGIKLIQFNSPSIYIIHYILKLKNGYNGNPEYPWEIVLIDNYGYYHNVYYDSWNRSYSPPAAILIKKDIKYIFPLTNAMIDAIKSNPTCIRPDSQYRVGDQYSPYYHVEGDSIDPYLSMLPVLQLSAISQWEHNTAINKLLEENIALKAKISKMEASAPTEDLLGLTGSSECAAGGCGEPSKNN